MSNKIDIRGYLNRKRQGKQANKLEKEAMRDPFLGDALDGYSSQNNDEQLLADLDVLQKRLQQRTEKKKKTPMLWWAAASIALLLTVGLGYQLLKTDTGGQRNLTANKEQKQGSDLNKNVEEHGDLNDSTSSPTLPVDPVKNIEQKKGQDGKTGREDNSRSTPSNRKVAPQARPDRGDQIALADRNKAVQKHEKQQHTISGTITDRVDGSPLPYVSVQVKDSKLGVLTDENGTFQLSIPDELKEAELIVSYLGFDSKELKANDSTYLAIALAPSTKQLDEVVVIGYGTEKKRSTTGAIQTIRADEVASESSPTASTKIIASQDAMPQLANAKSKQLEQNHEKKLNTISGTITDKADGSPLSFANVQVKNSTIGTITDINGAFQLSIPDELKEAELIFSYIGFDSKELKANDSTYLAIALAPSSSQLEEVVVTGYGAVMKRSLTGAAQTVGSNESGPTASVRLFDKQGAKPKMGKRAYKRQLRKELQELYQRTGTTERIRLVVSFTLDEEGYPEDIEVIESAGNPYDGWASDAIDEAGAWILPKNTNKLKKPIRIRLKVSK